MSSTLALQIDVPTMEIVDLPGIQGLPFEASMTSMTLVRKFLSANDTIVLCVIPATNASIDVGLALNLVRRYGKSERTIVALTKADRVDLDDPDEVRNQLFQPLLCDLDCLNGMGGCVAVCNRMYNDSVGVADMRACESAIFERVLATITRRGFITDANKQRLRANMGSKQLIVQLADMCCGHMLKSWCPGSPRGLKNPKKQHSTGQVQLNQPEYPSQDVHRETGETLAGIQSEVLHCFKAL